MTTRVMFGPRKKGGVERSERPHGAPHDGVVIRPFTGIRQHTLARHTSVGPIGEDTTTIRHSMGILPLIVVRHV
jgi:hypothetical protein